jgi:hypothetical protein
MNQQIQSTAPTNFIPARDLYNNYGAMLLGYISGIVNDPNIAGQYLVEVFKDLPDGLPADLEKGLSIFIRLQILARRKLEPFFETVRDCVVPEPATNGIHNQNKYLELMTPDQQAVFCGMHYHGKSVNILSLELNKPGEEIKKILKQSFTIIRNSSGR